MEIIKCKMKIEIWDYMWFILCTYDLFYIHVCYLFKNELLKILYIGLNDVTKLILRLSMNSIINQEIRNTNARQ